MADLNPPTRLSGNSAQRRKVERLLRRLGIAAVPRDPATPAPAGKENRSLWRFWEATVAILGVVGALTVTAIFPQLYWAFVVLVYFSLAGVFWDGYKGRWSSHKAARIIICLVALLGSLWWTFDVVIAKATLTSNSMFDFADYPTGTKIGSITWDKNLEEVQIYLTNDSDVDFQDVNLVISNDMLISSISQIEQICHGFQAFIGEHPSYIDAVDTSGKPFTAVPMGGGLSNKMRVECDKLPRKSTATLVVALIPTAKSSMEQLFPPKLTGVPKRKPLVSIDGEYRALGRTRQFRNQWSY